MPGKTITVFADDLTGACECAGIAHQHGFAAAVTLDPAAAGDTPSVLVVDTETRLASPADAARRLRVWLQAPAVRQRDGLVFKKTDSVLRGPVMAELEALAPALGRRRVLLVPGNPALGRIVRGGDYSIYGEPLTSTAFAYDPHHPARSSRVVELLGPASLPITALAPGAPWPDSGVIVGDMTSPGDFAAWAAALPADCLAAGSAPFFATLLTAHGHGPVAADSAPALDMPTLVISGTI
jgi:hypothetical protein